MRNVLFIFNLVIWVTQGVAAQSEPRFYADLPTLSWQAGATVEVAVGEPIQVSFMLENGKNNGRFTPPDWEAAGFMLLGSSQSSSISIINGETNAAASYNYTLTPAQEGTLTIPAVSIKNGDGELHTEPIIVQALPNADGARPALPKRSPTQPQSEPKRTFKTIKM